MGVLVFLLAIIPMSGGSHVNLMRAESPGPSVGKLVPKLKYTARILYIIYFGMTLLEIVLLLAGKMSLFDSITTAFGTAGTGGFGYDPIFFVPSEGKTAAELTREEKSAISHRGQALKLLLDALRNG